MHKITDLIFTKKDAMVKTVQKIKNDCKTICNMLY